MKYSFFTNIVVFFCVFVCISCNSSGTSSFVVDFDNRSSEDIILRFEDLVDELKVVALETRDDLMLPGFVFLHITPEYIVTVGEDEVHQFDHSGKHIRKLATKGRGPNEFTLITHLIDDHRNILYLIKYMGESDILRIDLNTGSFMEPLKPEMPIWGNVVDDKGNVVGIPDVNYYYRNRSKTDSLIKIGVVFVETKTGETINIPVCVGDPRNSSYVNIVKNRKGMYFYDCVNSDTLYMFDLNKVEPYKVLSLSDKMKDGMNKGYVLDLIECFGESFLFRMNYKEMKGNSRFPSQISEEYFLVDAEGNINRFDVGVINKYNIRQSNKEYNDSFTARGSTILYPGPVPVSTGDYLYHSFNTSNLIFFLERALEDKSTTAKQKQEIIELLSKVDDDDNHVIMYGKVRK